MTGRVLDAELAALLGTVDTPTVCNAIEVAQKKRGFDRFTRATMHHSSPGETAFGFARTARVSGIAPPKDPADVVKARRMAYFRSMADGGGPRLAVVEDIDHPNCVAGWWGEVHVAVHKGLGLAGAVTNGVMRDLDVIDEGFPLLAGAIGPSHAFAHVVDIGGCVTVNGMRVEQGELVHADRHGALVVPDEVIDDLAVAIRKVIDTEAIVLGPARKPGFDIEELERVWARFEASRT